MARETDRERHLRAMELFEQVCDLSGEERETLLAAECEGDDSLRAEVESLLREDRRDAPTLATPGLAESASRLARELAERSADHLDGPMPERIGRYRILGRLGRGGMSLVYDALQEAPRRRVALKSLRAGFITRDEQARFLREVEVLGRLDHPGIAKVFEAGVLEPSGAVDEARPWFAMELVEGHRLVEHADAAGLDWRARCVLLAEVCDAVHHAHVKGVIHRDLKPANVVVGADGRPKVLDFGVASAADELRADHSTTRQGMLLGTLQYMAPEQARGDAAAADVRSDVYSLGLIAFELLSGRPARELGDQSIASATRTVLDARPPRLSQVVPDLRGDPDAVVAKAVRESPERRYQSAEALADDLRALASGAAVSAVKPTAWDDFRRLVRRRKDVFAVAVFGVAALALVTVFAVGEARRADRALAEEADQRLVTERLFAAASANNARVEDEAARANLTAAQLALEVGDVGMLRRRLDAVPPARRGWSWQHLRARVDDSLRSWAGSGNRARHVHYDLKAGLATWHEAPPLAGPTLRVIWDLQIGDVIHRREYADARASERVPRHAAPLLLRSPWLPPGESFEVWDPRREELLGRVERCEGIETGGLSQAAGAHRVMAARTEIVVCDGATGEAKGRRARGRMRELRVDGRGRFVFSLQSGGDVEVLDVPTLDLVATLRGHRQLVRDIAASPDGRTVATTSGDGTLRWWSLPEGRETAQLSPHRGTVVAVAISPNGLYTASTGDDGGVRIFDTADKGEVATLLGHAAGPTSLAFSEDGAQLMSVGRDGGRLWAIGDRADARSWRLHESFVYDVALSPDGERIASASWDGRVLISRAEDGQVLRGLQVADSGQEYLLAVAWSSDGSRLVATAKRVAGPSWESLVQLWDPAEGRRLAELNLGPGHPIDVGFTADDSLVLVGCGGRWAVVEVAGWTPAGIVEARRPDLALLSERGFEHDPPWCPVDREPGMPLRPDGERLLASALETAGFANGLARSPDGSGWAVGLEGEILLVEEGSGRVRARRSLESRRVYALGWSAGGRDLFAGTDDSLLRVLAPETLEVLLTLDGHSSYIKALAVDRRSDTVFTASGDGSLRLWDRRSVAELHGRR